ncbi:septum formation family protein [Nocardioides sp. SR21]|uniref:septum formation family protein n=1 Tax=Nocardioides sp. SR21 TaxID=2919501 RepID=UPI001FAB24D4|nr:septum formation family protein [Nocardioides sp. SR21]
MNGEDLKFLAERSWTLEDRTPERLVDVHHRIAAHRRRRAATALATVAVVLVVLALGIALATTGTTGDIPDPAPTPTPAPNSAPIKPAEGTCWAVPAKLVVDPDHWVDDSDQVSCDQKHTTQTAAVLVLDEPTIEDAQRRIDPCEGYVLRYVGVSQDSWIPWSWVAFLPSQEEIDDGASWVRCDLVFPTTWEYAGAHATTGSGAGIADNPPTDRWGCFNTLPTDKTDQPYVPCDNPHVYEATGTPTFIDGLTAYPSVSDLETATDEQCLPTVPDKFQGMAITAAWSPRSTFTPGGSVLGACFAYNSDRSPLPAR